ncbi:MAG: methionine--tRNA ligase [Chthonomonadales bacterium]
MNSTRKAFYITTPIYYVNGRPHIGSALTTVCCDVLARWHRLRGLPAWFLTGTDEQATKVHEAALAAGLPPQQFVDGLAQEFVAAWRSLHISNDDFIRTTEARHVEAVQEFFRRLRATGDAYKGMYEGWYCVSDETFFRESDVGPDHLCPNPECRKPLLREQTESYFFRLSRYAEPLLAHIEANPGFLQPEFRRNEVISFIRQGLRDMSITRTNRGWGIPVPDEPDKVIYVWFDALINYLAATGWPSDQQRYRELWPADVHLMAKEIFVRFHATLWPAMLLAIGVPLPRTVYAHGWWVDAEGRKEGKRTGGLPHPTEFSAIIAGKSGADPDIASDALRYLLLREMVFHGDSEFSEASFLKRYNTDLANDLGNLCNRTVTMVHRYLQGRAPSGGPLSAEIEQVAREAARGYNAALEEFRFNTALEAVWRLVTRTNQWIEEKAPWRLAKQHDTPELNSVLGTCLAAIRTAALLLLPVMPVAAERILEQIGAPPGIPQSESIDATLWAPLPEGAPIPSPIPIFPRIQELSMANERTAEPSVAEEKRPAGDVITIEDFAKVDLRVADVIAAEPVPGATKLLKLVVDLGGERRTILAGIAEMYRPEELAGKQIVLLANLAPRKIRGVESQGMFLAADVDGQAILLQPETRVPAGSKIR